MLKAGSRSANMNTIAIFSLMFAPASITKSRENRYIEIRDV